MADNKIRVSWDDLSRPEVDDRVKQQEILARAQERNAASSGAAQSFVAPSKTTSSLWNNTLFYMPLFGLLGGLFGWSVGELIQIAIPNHFEAVQRMVIAENAITQKVSRGEISTSEAEKKIERLKLRYAANPYMKVFFDPTLQSVPEGERTIIVRERVLALQKKDEVRNWLQQLLWFTVLGLTVSFFLSVADHVMGRNFRSALTYGSAGVVLGAGGGLLVGLFINQLYRAMLGEGTQGSVQHIIARSICWGILGLFLAVAPGVVLRNWRRLCIGLAGGLIGGLVGGVLFDLLLHVVPSDVFSRFVGILAIGSVAGVGTGLIELVAKTGWIRVIGGLIAGKQFVLYKNPTYIGSSPQCEIYLFKDPQVGPQHTAIHQVSGGFEIEDLRSPTGTVVNGRPISRQRLRNDDQIQIGMTTLQFQERQRAQGA